MPLDFYGKELESVLNISSYQLVIEHLDFQSRRSFCANFVEAFTEAQVEFTDERIQKFLTAISPLYNEQEDQPLDFDEDDVVEDLVHVSKFVHHLFSCYSKKGPEVFLALIQTISGVFAECRVRLRFLFPTVVYKAFDLLKMVVKTKNSTVWLST